MTRSMKTVKIRQQLGREFKAAMRLSPLALAALLLVVLLWRSDSAANSGLFQSSPVETPVLTPTTPPIMPTSTVPAGQETATTMPPPPDTPTAEATLPVATESPLPVLTETPTVTATVELTVTPGMETITPTATVAATAEAGATPDDRARYSEGESNLQFEWGMLFDSVSLFLSYAWLCCGVLVFLAVPLVFIVLWVASKRRRQQEEE